MCEEWSRIRKEFMIDDQARRRYYASRFSLFVSYGVNSAATMLGPGCVGSLIRMRGPVYGQHLEAASYKLQAGQFRMILKYIFFKAASNKHLTIHTYGII